MQEVVPIREEVPLGQYRYGMKYPWAVPVWITAPVCKTSQLVEVCAEWGWVGWSGWWWWEYR